MRLAGQALSGVGGRRLRRGAMALAAVVALGLMMSLLSACTGVKTTAPPDGTAEIPARFANRNGQPIDKSFTELLRWWLARAQAGLPKAPAEFVQGYAFPIDKPDLAFLHANRSAVSVTWIGHATLLIQMGGINILTDPHFSQRAFPVQWLGPQRRVALPVALSELPRIDLVVISHSHYDHLDRDTVQALRSQPGGSPLFLVPLGLERWMREEGVTRVERFNWWESRELLGVRIDFVPVHHWSQRTALDRNTTLWGGWLIRSPDFRFLFMGDTGYSGDFADIGARFGGVDLAAIPVGAYEPRWFMKDQHVDPAEAVKIHQDVRAVQSVGIHWGTFELTDEPLDAPIGALPRALDAAGVARSRFVLMRHGETRLFPFKP